VESVASPSASKNAVGVVCSALASRIHRATIRKNVVELVEALAANENAGADKGHKGSI